MRWKEDRRFKRFSQTQDWYPKLLYRREAWVYRRCYGRWATAEQMRALNTALAKHFNVKEPRLYLSLPKRMPNVVGYFHVTPDGRHWIHVRGAREAGWVEFYAVNNRCQNYRLLIRTGQGEYQVRVLLHEWAHYLCYLWWAHGAHDARFASVLEAVYAWYARRRKKEALREVRWRRHEE